MPPRDPLLPDPEALEQWRQLPESESSKQALPPLTGGLRQSKWMIVALIIIGLIALLLGQRPA